MLQFKIETEGYDRDVYLKCPNPRCNHWVKARKVKIHPLYFPSIVISSCLHCYKRLSSLNLNLLTEQREKLIFHIEKDSS